MDKKRLMRTFGAISVVWCLLTALTGAVAIHLGPDWLARHGISKNLHPQWSILSFIPILFFQYYGIRFCFEIFSGSQRQDYLIKRYVIIIGLVASMLTGAATHMGFLPLFFHQLVSWPLVFYFIWDVSKVLFRRQRDCPANGIPPCGDHVSSQGQSSQ